MDLLGRRPDIVSPTAAITPADESTRPLVYSGFKIAPPGLLMIPNRAAVAELGFHAVAPLPKSVLIRAAAERPCVSNVTVNQKPAGTLAIGPGRGEYSLNLPEGSVKPGLNELALAFDDVPEKRDGSRAAIELITISGVTTPVEWNPGPPASLTQAPASDLSWFSPPGVTGLEIAFDVTASGKAEYQVEIFAKGDDIAERLVWSAKEQIQGAKAVQAAVRLSGFEDKPLLLRVGFKSGIGDARLKWNRLDLMGSEDAAPAKSPAPAPGSKTRPNVVVFLVDTLRRDHLSLYGYKHPTSPELEKLAADAVVFDSAWSQCSWTSPTVASLFTGEYPSSHGIKVHGDSIHPDFKTLAEALKERDYRTVAVVANAGIGDRAGNYHQGFDDFVFLQRQSARTLTKAALERTQGQPFFLYVHVMDVHYPYDEAEQPFNRLVRRPDGARINDALLSMESLRRKRHVPSAVELDYVQSLYDSEIGYVDDAFGRFVAGLRERGLYENTLIVFISDHGEEFREHGSYYHGHTLYNELTRVALLMKPPSPFVARRLTEPVQTIDVYPTVLGLLGESQASLPGRDLAPVLRGKDGNVSREYPIYTETELQADFRSVLIGRYKLIMFDRSPSGIADVCKLYDLEADPIERSNLVNSQPVRVGYMAGLLRRHLETQRARHSYTREEIHKTLDEETKRELEALGYVNAGDE